MKKRTLMIIAVLTAASLLAVLAFAGTTQENGYELFKDVLKNQESYDVESGEVIAHLSIKDNNETIMSLDATIAGSETNQEFGGNVSIVTEQLEKELEIYGLEGLVYILDTENNDVYVGKDDDSDMSDYDRPHDRANHDGEFDEKGEAILDFIIGDLANEFESVQDTDGTTDVKFELTKSEIPALLNMLTSMSSDSDSDYDYKDDKDFTDEELAEYAQYPLFNELESIEFDHPELVEDITLDYLSITLDLDAEQQIKGVAVKVMVSGEDETGLNHVIEVEGTVEMSFGTVTVQPIDLTNKTVYELPEEMMHE